MLVEKEDGDSGRGDELVDLGTPVSQCRPGEAVDGSFPYAVGLVADQYLDVVGPCLHKTVEVLEHVLDARRALAGILPHGLREGAGSRGVQGRITLTIQFTEQ